MQYNTAKSLLEVHRLAGDSAQPDRGWLSKLADIVRFVAAEHARHRMVRKGVSEMLQMDHWMLSDIGISRGEVYMIADNIGWGRWCLKMLVLAPSASKFKRRAKRQARRRA
jgi:uncharacterized protein YjiS (DUF1127 family)